MSTSERLVVGEYSNWPLWALEWRVGIIQERMRQIDRELRGRAEAAANAILAANDIEKRLEKHRHLLAAI